MDGRETSAAKYDDAVRNRRNHHQADIHRLKHWSSNAGALAVIQAQLVVVARQELKHAGYEVQAPSRGLFSAA